MTSLAVLMLTLSAMVAPSLGVDWGDRNWAFACDFSNNDFDKTTNGRGENCGPTCDAIPQCTHFTYNQNIDGGTCFLKNGHVTKADAFDCCDKSVVCGVSSRQGHGFFPGLCSLWAHKGLEAHNFFRRLHGVPDLVLNSRLCGLAQEWADRLLKENLLEHKHSEFGENIFVTDNQEVFPESVVNVWHSEMEHHTFGPTLNVATKHFTQVVWKSSRELGMAVATGGGRTVVVAFYDPPGNIEGGFLDNVFRMH